MLYSSRVLDLLQRCTHKQLKQIHAVVITALLGALSDVRLKLLRRSTEFGEMEYPNLIFGHMGGPRLTDVSLWNAMVRGYDYNGPFEKCLNLFDEMLARGLTPNNFTYPYVLNCCSKLGRFKVGQKAHCRAVKSGFEKARAVGNALFEFYVKGLGPLDDARRVFDSMDEKRVEVWNRMVGKYVSVGDVDGGRVLFDEMTERDVVSWNTMMSGYAKVGDEANARDLFERMPERNVLSWTVMLGAYAEGGDIGVAREIFDQMPERNVVSWNCMISGYAKIGRFHEALDLFVRMQAEGTQPDCFTFVAALSACSKASILEMGKWVHGLIADWPKMGVVVGTALVEMYANCGDINSSFVIFVKIGNKDVFLYNVMIKCLAIHGRAEDAVKIFRVLQKIGLMPNDCTYLAVLFACSHGGLVMEGREIFKDMKIDLRTSPKLEHYCSMIDMLCRNDRLEEADTMMKEMQEEPDIAIWRALLGGCRERGNLEFAEGIMSRVVKLKSRESGVHVLSSNIHASMGQWSDAQRVRRLMEEKGIWKRTGMSRIT